MESMTILAEGDTAGTFLLYVWIEEGILEELNICQVFCMDFNSW